MNKISVYLDNCCFNRPYDDQSQMKVSLEAQAKMYVQRLIVEKQCDFVYSYMSVYENSKNPYENRKKAIADFFENATCYVSDEHKDEILKMVNEIIKTGIKTEDATHVACAIFGKAKIFLTTDKRLLKFKTNKISLMSPVDFVRDLEELL